MRKQIVLVAILLVVSSAGMALSVSRHKPVSLSATDADRILRDGRDLLAKKDSKTDTGCSVPALKRTGGVTVSTFSDGVIDSKSEFNKVLAQYGYAKVVTKINWCGKLKPNVIGCARRGNPSFLVVRHRRLEGLLWAHEYGHSKGLSHNADKKAIMYESVGNTRKEVTGDECKTFKK